MPNFDGLSVAYILFLKLHSVVICRPRPLSANRKTHLRSTKKMFCSNFKNVHEINDIKHKQKITELQVISISPMWRLTLLIRKVRTE